MSTEKSPEQIAEERYPTSHDADEYTLPGAYHAGEHRGYIDCYREHVLNRQGESDADTVVVKYQTDSDGIIDGSGETWTACGYDNPDRVQERFRGDFRRVWIAAWHESRVHLIGKSLVVPKTRISTPPVTVDGIIEVVKEWDRAYGVDPHPSSRRYDTVMSDLRSRLESYLTPNTKP